MGIVKVSVEDETEQLDVQKAIAFLPLMSVSLFLGRNVTFCNNQSREMLCLQQDNFYTFRKLFEFNVITEKMKNLKIDSTYKDRIAKDFISYLKLKSTVQDHFKNKSSEPVILKIKEMYEKYPSKYLDWLQIINNQLLSESQRTLDDEVMIRNPELLTAVYDLFAEQKETWVKAMVIILGLKNCLQS